jgi:hypothetical protein
MSPVFGFNTDIRHGDTVYHVQTEAREAELTLRTAIFVRGRCIDKHESSYAEEAAVPGFTEGSVHRLLTRQHKFIVSSIREGKIGSLSLEGVARAAAAGSTSARAASIPEVSPVASGFANEAAEQSVQTPPETATTADDADILGLAFDPSLTLPKPSSPVAPDAAPKPLPDPEPISELVETPQLAIEWLYSEIISAGAAVKVRYCVKMGSRGVEGAKIVARFEIGNVPSSYARTVTNPQGDAEVIFTLAPAAQNSASLSITVQASHAGQSIARRFRLSKS